MALASNAEKVWNEVQVDFPRWIKQSTVYITELRSIAKSIDEYHEDVAVANLTGTCIGAAGGVLSIAGLIGAPFTLGSSLLLTGIGVAAGVAGGATNIVASVCDNNNQTNKQKRVNEIVQQYQEMTKNLTDKLTQLNQTLKYLLQLEDRNLPNAAFLSTARGLMNSLSFMTVTMTRRTVSALKNISGILAALTIAWDVFSIVNDALEIGKKGTEISGMIRQIANHMEEERSNMEKIYLRLKDFTE